MVLSTEQKFDGANRLRGAASPGSEITRAARQYRPVPAVARAAAILRALGDGQGEASLTDLARLLRIHKSTAHGILATLAANGLVERDSSTRRYRLGRTLAALGRAAADREDLGELARPHLVRLARLSRETVALHLRAGGGSVIVASEESPHQLKVTAPSGHRLPPFAGAVAKVLQAFVDHPALRLPARLPAYTPQAITDPSRYRQELDRVRREGVAYDDAEYLPGVRAISVPVFRGRPSENAEAIGAMSIVGVSARMTTEDLRRLARPLQAAARALSEALLPAAHPGGLRRGMGGHTRGARRPGVGAEADLGAAAQGRRQRL